MCGTIVSMGFLSKSLASEVITFVLIDQQSKRVISPLVFHIELNVSNLCESFSLLVLNMYQAFGHEKRLIMDQYSFGLGKGSST